jgi:chromosome segregation ATPase
MPAVEDVSFELERFEWTGDDTLEVVGRWNGVRGRRMTRPALTIEAGGRRHRLTGSADADADPWRASFSWDGSRGDVTGAELELGRSLVVELPPPRRRRRRRGATAELDLRVQLDELRRTVAELTEERERLLAAPARDQDGEDDATNLREALAAAAAAREAASEAREEADRLRAELAKLRTQAPATEELEALRNDASEARADADRLRESLRAAEASSVEAQGLIDELAGLRLAHGSLKAAHERLEDELEVLRAARDERDELKGQIERSREDAGDEEREKAALGEVIRELQERTTLAEKASERLTGELVVAREDISRLQSLLAQRDEALSAAQQDAERRVETERASVTEVHERLADTREQAQRTIVAEAEETERLRAELERTRDDAEKLLAAERAEVARLREALLNSEVDPAAEESARRMIERVTRDLDRERATSRTLRREIEALQSATAEHRRATALSGNGTTVSDVTEPAPRAVRTPLGTQRRVEAARTNSASRVPRVPPSRASFWIVRVLAAGLVAFLGYILLLVYQAIA